MKPMKVYPKIESKSSLLKIFEAEKSLLGTNIDSKGRYFIIIDADYSKWFKEVNGGE